MILAQSALHSLNRGDAAWLAECLAVAHRLLLLIPLERRSVEYLMFMLGHP